MLIVNIDYINNERQLFSFRPNYTNKTFLSIVQAASKSKKIYM